MLKRGGDGFIAVNGQAVQKAAMECGKVRPQLQNMKERGPADCRMATARKPMLMAVFIQFEIHLKPICFCMASNSLSFDTIAHMHCMQ